ncbi:MAG: alpha-E domain-containing protein [Chitinophagaceae bacterium]|nr:alpha-E domain-containing protein [Chitinophagaceae bacterium]
MLSRIADSLFWLNRYMERCDGLLRVVHTNYILSFDKSPYGVHSWRPVLQIFTFADEKQMAELEFQTADTLKYLVLDTGNMNSLKVIINRARENARGIQDNITKEVWEQVNQMYHQVNNNKLERTLAGNNVLTVIDQFIENALLYTGVTDSTMPRGMSWSFMNLGKYIERCLITIEMVDKNFQSLEYNLDNSRDILYWRNLLLSLSGYELHLKTYRSTDYNHNVAHQVLFNKDFTRSIIYSLERIKRYLEDVVDENKPAGKEQLEKNFGRLYSQVQYADFELINQLSLQKFLAQVRTELLNFAKQLGQTFFSYS